MALALLSSLLVPLRAGADRAACEFFASRAQKALDSRTWAAAQEDFRRALEEDATYLPARHGLAEALLGGGDRDGGVQELRAFVEGVAGDASAPPAWTALAARAKGRLAALDAATARLDQITGRRAADLVSLAERWAAKDPGLARSALAEALALRPDDPKAREAVEKLGAPAGRATSVFDGKTWDAWLGPIPREYSIAGGVLIADVPREAAVHLLGKQAWEGDLDVRMEARLVEDRTADHPMLFLLHSLATDAETHSTFGVLDVDLVWYEERAGRPREDVFASPLASLAKPIDPKQWTTYELRYRKDKVHAFVNGEEVHVADRPADRTRGGVGVRVQNGKVEFRRIEVEAR
jgi:hypothetical protein